MCQTCPLQTDWVLSDLTHDELLTLEDLLNTWLTIHNVLGVILHITAIENRVFLRTNVNKSRFHTRQDILHFSDINISVNLRFIVCGTTHVMLNQAAPLHDRHLGNVGTHLHGHKVTPDRTPIAFTTSAALNDISIGSVVVTNICATASFIVALTLFLCGCIGA